MDSEEVEVVDWKGERGGDIISGNSWAYSIHSGPATSRQSFSHITLDIEESVMLCCDYYSGQSYVAEGLEIPRFKKVMQIFEVPVNANGLCYSTTRKNNPRQCLKYSQNSGPDPGPGIAAQHLHTTQYKNKMLPTAMLKAL